MQNQSSQQFLNFNYSMDKKTFPESHADNQEETEIVTVTVRLLCNQILQIETMLIRYITLLTNTC